MSGEICDECGAYKNGRPVGPWAPKGADCPWCWSPCSNYIISQGHIAQAEEATRKGDDVGARDAYRKAAAAQVALVDAAPPDRVRTVFGLSAVTLLRRAGDLDGAGRLARRFMAEPWLQDRERALLEVVAIEVSGACPVVHASLVRAEVGRA